MSGRPLLAASNTTSGDPTSSSSVSSNQSQPNNQTSGRPRRTLIESACTACRRRKSRCDGNRPSCSRCVALRTDCVYHVEEGESRWSALKRKNQELEEERNELRDLVHEMQGRPEGEAQEILMRIRVVRDDSELLELSRQLRTGSLTFPRPAQAGPSARVASAAATDNYRLPPLRELLKDIDDESASPLPSASPPRSEGQSSTLSYTPPASEDYRMRFGQ